MWIVSIVSSPLERSLEHGRRHARRRAPPDGPLVHRPSSRPLLPAARLTCEPRSGAPAAPARHVAGGRAGRGLPVWQRLLPEGRPITTYRDRQAGTDRGGMDLACGHATRPPRAGAPHPAAPRPRAVSQAHAIKDLCRCAGAPCAHKHVPLPSSETRDLRSSSGSMAGKKKGLVSVDLTGGPWCHRRRVARGSGVQRSIDPCGTRVLRGRGSEVLERTNTSPLKALPRAGGRSPLACQKTGVF
jgi:hypothetical protein